MPNVYPILKQVKPKLTTAMKSTILIGLVLLSIGFLYTLQPSVEGLTAYRYGSTHVSIITVKNYRCNIKLVEKYLVSTEENRFEYSPVPKRCQEIRQIKIYGADQPFFTIFWRENHKKYEIKRD